MDVPRPRFRGLKDGSSASQRETRKKQPCSVWIMDFLRKTPNRLSSAICNECDFQRTDKTTSGTSDARTSSLNAGLRRNASAFFWEMKFVCNAVQKPT